MAEVRCQVSESRRQISDDGFQMADFVICHPTSPQSDNANTAPASALITHEFENVCEYVTCRPSHSPRAEAVTGP
jgi:hypothetical protein